MKRSHLAAGFAAAVAISTAAVPAASWAEPWHQVQGNQGSGLTTTVTLITGDVVTVAGSEVKARPAKGREGTRFRSFTDTRGDLHVVPEDAQEQINSGRLDERLFDVSLLARSGYDDASRPTIPLIVQGGVATAGAEALPSIGARAVKVEKDGSFWSGVRAAGDAKVWLDGRVTASLDRSAKQIGAPQAWEKGFTGNGATVAVLDTGVDATHPDLAGAVVEEKNFSDSPTTDDMVGHGTHVAATVTGGGKYQGIAPDAKIINGKVLGDHGGGYESDIIAGMEWGASKAKVVNMSLGSSWPSEGDDPMSQALNRISATTGALFVVSAGNSGGAPGSPASADSALTVGAVDRDEKLAEFSSRGPRWVNNAIKPDITAPGVGIVAAKAKNGFIGTPVGDQHVALDGTSMASPHVAGAAAILAAQHPSWTGQDIKAALMTTAKPNPALSPFEQGSGRVDVARAVTAPVTSLPGSLSMGTALWPHTDDQPITSKLTYRNSSSAEVTLDLSIAEQKPAGQGLFSVSPAKLTIPAGGTASATVTADTRVNVPDALYTAVVLGSDGTRTPISVDKEVESYDIKLSFLDHDGKPTALYNYRFVGVDVQKAWLRHDPSGTITQRIPKGKYYFETTISTRDPDPQLRGRATVAVEPAFEVTGDAALTVDARNGTSPSITVDRPEAKAAQSELRFAMEANWGPTGTSWITDDFTHILVTPSKTSWPKFNWHAQSVLAKPSGVREFLNSPYQYHVRIAATGKVPADVQRTVRDSELARVDSVTHARVPGSIGQRDGGAAGALPLKLQEFYTPGVPWYGSLTEFTKLGEWPALGSQYGVVPRTYKLGRKTTEHWNSAVFGPAFPSEGNPDIVRSAGRARDFLRLEVPMFSDSGTTYGYGSTSGKTTLSSGGKVLFEGTWPGDARAEVPPAAARYDLHAEGGRDSVSSSVVADWSFTSAHVPGDRYRSIPLLAVRFSPKLDEYNRAAAGRPLTIPVTVQRNGTASNVVDVRAPEIQVSYDEGKSWKPVRAVKAGKQWLVTLWHPKDAKSVSFKAKTSDKAGSVSQTILRAYDLK